MIKKFKLYEAGHEDIDPYNEEIWEISFSEEEIKLLEDQGFEPTDTDKYTFPTNHSLIQISKNEHEEDKHIYYRVVIIGYLPGGGEVAMYKKRFRTLDHALRRLYVDIDGVINQLMGIIIKHGM